MSEKAISKTAQAALEAKYGLDTLKVDFPAEFVVAGQIGTYYVCWNINEPLLP